MFDFFLLWAWFLFKFAAGFESDRFDVWFNTWCKEMKTTFSEELIFELLTCFVKEVGVSIHAIGVLNQTFRKFDSKCWVLLLTLIWFRKCCLLNQLSFFVISFFLFFFFFFVSEFFWWTLIFAIFLIILTPFCCSLVYVLCERCLIFSSMWTLFSRTWLGFWVRPFWRLIQNLVQRGDNNVFWRADCWDLDFCCGTSWSKWIS